MTRDATGSDGFPARRVVLLGASNLTRSFPLVLQIAHDCWGGPLDVLAAQGFGRSYGQRSQVLFRALPGILECGLWDALRNRPPAETAALVTDIGNDILYGVPVPRIAAWVEECVQRLLAVEAKIVMTGLPLCSLQTLSPGRFRLFRRLTYPACRLDLAMTRQLAQELNHRIAELAARHQLPLVEPLAEWYGLDPIHVKSGACPTAWSCILREWPPSVPSQPVRYPLLRRVQTRLLKPERWWRWGRERHQSQPAARWPDGTVISLY